MTNTELISRTLVYLLVCGLLIIIGRSIWRTKRAAMRVSILLLAVIFVFLSFGLRNDFDQIDYSSRYLIMRDGVKIAVDVYLPGGRKPGARLPAILRQTRYYRSYDLRWPAGLFIRTSPLIREFLDHGYAFVFVDTRGSGASFGTRTREWSPDEVKDGAEVVDWIIRQDWSNGKVGAEGVSYDGTAAEYLLVNNHPAVKAVATVFSLYDAYTDIALPGGILENQFTEIWTRDNAALDRNDFGPYLSLPTRLVFKGVKPVQADDGTLLAAAIRDHSANYNVYSELIRATYRDERSKTGDTIDIVSPFSYRKEIQASATPIYSIDGWYDCGFTHGAVKRFLSVRNSGSRLLIGPWTHGGDVNVGPFGKNERFNLIGELVRFFDHYLKDVDNGIDKEPAVRYFTIGEEAWKTAETWPPPGVKSVPFFFGMHNSLAIDKTGTEEGSNSYLVDYSAGTGDTSRWNSLVFIDKKGFGYPDRNKQDKKLLVYSTAPLEAATEVTGHPVVTLFVKSTATDGNFFAYLEDIDEQGHIEYVTEGMIRMLHSSISTDPPPYTMVVPYHSFKKSDAIAFKPGTISQLSFDLQPISYLFKRGHSIRIALAGADKDHFANLAMGPPTIEVFSGGANASRIDLPVMFH